MWNLDEPEKWKHYSQDLKKEKLVFSKSQLGGDSVMNWWCFAYSVGLPIAFVSSEMSLEAHQRVPGSLLLPNAEFYAGKILKFQQNIISVYVSNRAKHSSLINNVETEMAS